MFNYYVSTVHMMFKPYKKHVTSLML